MSPLSAHYLLFLSVVVGCAWLFRERPTYRKNLLLIASYYFYACWDWRFISLVLIITLVTYTAAKKIASASDTTGRKKWLAIASLICLGVLAYFKYADFFIAGAASLLEAMGLQANVTLLRLILPLGISFFTFQALSYVIDVYRGQQVACNDLRDIALFIAFFPTVQAGPVTRAKELLPQFNNPRPFLETCLQHGLGLIVRGFVKKIVFADVLAMHLVDPAFSNPGQYSFLFLLLALYGYSFQIYMDVSAYTDIARGTAFMCGYRLPKNFDRPYTAATLSNFWQRWHMSISSFFRDYLFISIGGSRHGNVYANLMITFVAIGFWHGAGWGFIVYGLIHGTVICIERFLRSRRDKLGRPPPPITGIGWLVRVALIFHIVVFSRVLFRAPNLSAAVDYLAAMLQGDATGLPISIQAALALGGAALLHWVVPNAGAQALDLFKRSGFVLQGIALSGLGYFLIALSVGDAPFLYFKF